MVYLNKVLNGLKIQLEHPVVDITDCSDEEKDQIPLGLAYKFKTIYIARWVEDRLLVFSEKDEKYFAIYRNVLEANFYPYGELHIVCNKALDEKFVEKLRKELEDENTDKSHVLIYACDEKAGYKTVDLIPLRELIADLQEDLKEEAKMLYKLMIIKKKEEELKRKEEEVKKLKEELKQLRGEVFHD